MNFILKIVEGPNKGAEIALVEGVTVTLGKGEDCDVVLADPTMPDAPLPVEASADGVAVGGEPLESFSVKTFGATSFAVGPADAPWGDLKWPKAESLKAEDREAQDEKRESEAPPRAARLAPEESPREEGEEKKKRGGCFGCLLALLVLLLVLAVLVWFFRDAVKPHAESLWEKLCAGRSGLDGSPTAQTSDSGTLIPDLREIAGKYSLSLVESDGRAQISGNLKTRRDRLSATAEAYGAQPGVELDLSDDESLRASAEDALFTLTEGAIKVVTATNRVVSIAGSSASPLSFKKTLEALNADLPKLRGIDASGVVISPIVAGTDGYGTEDVEQADGTSSPRGSRRKSKKPQSTTLPVCGILTTPYPCLVMRDGRRVMEGATIADSVIVEIGADSVTLTNSTGRFTWKP